MSQIILPIQGSPDPIAPPASQWSSDNEPFLAFDNQVDELVLWTFDVPSDYGSGLTASVSFSCAVAAGTFQPSIEIKCVAEGQSLTASVWGAANAAPATAVPGTIGNRGRISWALPNLGAPSVWAPDLYTAIRLRRDTSDGGIAAGDVYVWAASLVYTAA